MSLVLPRASVDWISSDGINTELPPAEPLGRGSCTARNVSSMSMLQWARKVGERFFHEFGLCVYFA